MCVLFVIEVELFFARRLSWTEGSAGSWRTFSEHARPDVLDGGFLELGATGDVLGGDGHFELVVLATAHRRFRQNLAQVLDLRLRVHPQRGVAGRIEVVGVAAPLRGVPHSARLLELAQADERHVVVQHPLFQRLLLERGEVLLCLLQPLLPQRLALRLGLRCRSATHLRCRQLRTDSARRQLPPKP